jgi:hypothetical protein
MVALQLIAVCAIAVFGMVSLMLGSSFERLAIVLLLGVCVGLILRCADGR